MMGISELSDTKFVEMMGTLWQNADEKDREKLKKIIKKYFEYEDSADLLINKLESIEV